MFLLVGRFVSTMLVGTLDSNMRVSRSVIKILLGTLVGKMTVDQDARRSVSL